MTEIEVKILDIDRSVVESKLIALGAKKVSDGELHALFFNFPMNPMPEKVRLRTDGKKTVMTLKEKIPDPKMNVRKENEVEVSDIGTMADILKLLGLSLVKETKKYRTVYRLDDTEFVFDRYLGKVSYIPEFLEIEGPDQETIYGYAAELGFSPDDCKPWSMRDLKQHYSSL